MILKDVFEESYISTICIIFFVLWNFFVCLSVSPSWFYLMEKGIFFQKTIKQAELR